MSTNRLNVTTEPKGKSNHLVSGLLIAIFAIGIVLASVPLVIRPLVQRWQTASATPAPAEAWPTAPAAYVPPTPAAEAAALPQPTPTPLPLPEWRELSYLTSIEFTATSVVDAKRTTEIPLLGDMITDRLLLKVVGAVQVGIDLSQVKNVQRDGRSIRFTVPQPDVTSVELLPNQSQVYSREQVIFLSQYEGLETDALEQARQQLRAQIQDNPSMMKMSEQFARLQLTEFLRKAGFTEVEITFEEISFD